MPCCSLCPGVSVVGFVFGTFDKQVSGRVSSTSAPLSFLGGGSMRVRTTRLLVFLLLACFASAQDVASFEKRITVKKLDNGLTVLICRRPEAPVFSFFTHVDAGSVQDPLNKTGLAHMFEHMAFKGTDKIGTTDYAKEKPALEKVETTYAAYSDELHKRVG